MVRLLFCLLHLVLRSGDVVSLSFLPVLPMISLYFTLPPSIPPFGTPPLNPARGCGERRVSSSASSGGPDRQMLYGAFWTENHAFGDTKTTLIDHLFVSQLGWAFLTQCGSEWHDALNQCEPCTVARVCTAVNRRRTASHRSITSERHAVASVHRSSDCCNTV